MSEMQYRTVTLSARVYSGSDDHAKHTVYWALQGPGLDVLVQELRVEEDNE